MSEKAWNRVALIIFIIVAAMILFNAKAARAHSWYDHDCCSTDDCYPVDDSEVIEEKPGQWKHIPTGATFKNDPGMRRIRPSHTSGYHVCISKYSHIGYCIYIPTGS